MTRKLLLLVVCALVACDGDSSGPDDTNPSLTLSVDSVRITIGLSATVNATVANSSATTQFVSRNEAVATVTPSGTINAVALGTTYVVGSLTGMPEVRDSVRVRVIEQGQLGSMQLLGTGLVQERWTSEVAARGGFAYTGTWGFRTFGNLGHPGNVIKVWNVAGNVPLLVDSLIILNVGTVSDVQVSDDGALLVASLENGGSDANGLVIFSLANPARPAFRGYFHTSLNMHTVKLGRVGGRHYAFASAQANARLVIVDITNPDAPVEVHNSLPGGAIHDTFVRDGILFAALWSSGLRIYDIGGGGRGGTPANPVAISTIVTSLCRVCGGGANVHNVWWYHDPNTNEKRYAFVGEEGPGDVGNMISRGALHVVDVSDLANPREVAVYEPDPATTVNGQNAGAHNFVMDEPSNILYAAFYNGGVRALDVRGDLSACAEEQKTNGFCDLAKMGREVGVAANEGAPKYIWGVARVGTALYASDMWNGIHKIDISAMQR
ncbi:MAG TPA: hypothetical protein VFO52_13120 [Longimicrobiales bacterium]|nr:hypothetical protein [Longimicrobiales bacterium]